MLDNIVRKIVEKRRLDKQHQKLSFEQNEQAKFEAEKLDHIIYAMHLSGDLKKLTSEQVESILYSLESSGHVVQRKEIEVSHALPQIKAEQLDHVIHAMRVSEELKHVTNEQVDNIVFALKEAGFLNSYKDVRDANYNDAHLISYHNADFLTDPLFVEAYKLGKATNSWLGFDIRWRVYTLCWAAFQAKQLEGDYVECGVNRGGFSRAAMHYIDFANMKDKTFYLLDTFCGIPKEDHHLATCYQDAYDECYEEVKETFKSFDNAKIIRGKVPSTLDQVPSKKVCYLSIDMNYAEPEIAAIEYFWDKLVPGALVILDDYGAGVWHIRQKQAFDRFAEEKGIKVLTLPTCQGLIIK